MHYYLNLVLCSVVLDGLKVVIEEHIRYYSEERINQKRKGSTPL